ncbi:hypothetical protein BKA93DRAFT_827070 [Sparassis latifolia]|uniref:NudC domain-containing protein 1 n=1 Tax=Sparassis crispa TaxID=139825 RepID=A0A401GRZ6_9APHY|nr:hypothetical protein SCP_0701120 [Sparassis crispa]GBE84930.1 hypothetical protein SCP_0701120 [Sparassis crispa]
MSFFQTNHFLRNSKFEGYKLSPISQDQAVSHYALEHKPSQANVSGRSHVSFQEVQSRISHNHLTICEQNERAVYIDGELRVISVDLDKAALVPSFKVLYEIPRPIQSPAIDSPQREYPSAAFLHPSLLFVSDGYGYVYALRIYETDQAELLGVYELSVPHALGSSKATVPVRMHQAVQATAQAAVVVLSSKHYPRDSASPDGQTRGKPAVEFDVWAVRFALPIVPSEGAPRSLDILWHRRGEDVPLYTTYDETRSAFLFVGGSPYRPLGVPGPQEYEPSADELAPIPRQAEDLDNVTNVSQPIKPPPYSWTQTDDSVTLAIPLPSSTPTEDIKIAFSPTTLTVLVRGESAMVGDIKLPHYDLKKLWDNIHASSSMWTWDRAAEHRFGVLSLHLDKQHDGTRWSQVFAAAGTSAGSPASHENVEVPETLDPSELWNIREALEKYTAALNEGQDASGLGLGRGVPRLAEGEMDDEVDLAVGRLVYLTWVGVDGAHLPWADQDIDAGPINVLSTPFPGVRGAARPTLVVKNDLDGVVYTLSAGSGHGDPPAWSHTSTFSALSFVLASKRDTRFTYHISQDAVFAFESGSGDSGGNVYIYRGVPTREKWAKQAVVKVGGGVAGSLLGLGILGGNLGKAVILALCEREFIVLHDML